MADHIYPVVEQMQLYADHQLLLLLTLLCFPPHPVGITKMGMWVIIIMMTIVMISANVCLFAYYFPFFLFKLFVGPSPSLPHPGTCLFLTHFLLLFVCNLFFIGLLYFCLFVGPDCWPLAFQFQHSPLPIVCLVVFFFLCLLPPDCLFVCLYVRPDCLPLSFQLSLWPPPSQHTPPPLQASSPRPAQHTG